MARLNSIVARSEWVSGAAASACWSRPIALFSKARSPTRSASRSTEYPLAMQVVSGEAPKKVRTGSGTASGRAWYSGAKKARSDANQRIRIARIRNPASTPPGTAFQDLNAEGAVSCIAEVRMSALGCERACSGGA
jgi:hypothetical protein